MDRFIASANSSPMSRQLEFKIQYGQIYSYNIDFELTQPEKFKIQYGQIYSIF